MSDQGERRHLTYILDSITLIEARVKAGRSEFSKNIDLQDAVLWRLETLTEATGKLSTEVKNRHPEVPWRAIYGFRNVAAHAYMSLRLAEVWDIIETDLPGLKNAVIQELDKLPAV